MNYDGLYCIFGGALLAYLLMSGAFESFNPKKWSI